MRASSFTGKAPVCGESKFVPKKQSKIHTLARLAPTTLLCFFFSQVFFYIMSIPFQIATLAIEPPVTGETGYQGFNPQKEIRHKGWNGNGCRALPEEMMVEHDIIKEDFPIPRTEYRKMFFSGERLVDNLEAEPIQPPTRTATCGSAKQLG